MKVKLSPKNEKNPLVHLLFFCQYLNKCPKIFLHLFIFCQYKAPKYYLFAKFWTNASNVFAFPPNIWTYAFKYLYILLFFLPTFEQMLHIIDCFSITRTNALKYFYIRCRCCLIYLPIVSQTLGSCLWPPLQSLFIVNMGNNILVLYIIVL